MAAVPPKLTAVAPVKSVHVMVTVAPGLAEVGVNDTMVGAGIIGGSLESFLQEIASVVSRNPLKIRHVFLICFIVFLI